MRTELRLQCCRADQFLCNWRDRNESQHDDEMQRQQCAFQNPQLMEVNTELIEVVAGEMQASQSEFATIPHIQVDIGDFNQIKSEIRVDDGGIQFARSLQFKLYSTQFLLGND